MDQNKQEELLYHAKFGRYLEVQSLLNEGVDLEGKNSIGQTPLMLAAQGSHIEVFELLINSGADINCCDDDGFTLLHYASVKESVEMLQSLVNKRVELDVKQTPHGSPLNLAVRNSYCYEVREIVELLVNLGADVNCCDENGFTVLHRASYRGFVDVVQYLLTIGVPVDAKFKDGVTPLMCAAGRSHRQVVELLINSGADIHCSDNDGWTVLHYASKFGSAEVVQYLVNKGGDINDRNSGGQTPLHLAAVGSDKTEPADSLFKAGADCNLEDNEGESPFSSLIKLKMRQMVSLSILNSEDIEGEPPR